MSNVSIKRINYLGTSNKSLAIKSIISDILTMLAFVFLKLLSPFTCSGCVLY